MTKARFGIVGWKNSGKTTLLVALVEEFVKRGICVSSVKHSSSKLQFDKQGTDSFRHQQAGTHQTVLIAEKKSVVQTQHDDEITLDNIIEQLNPCDLVLIEGFKSEGHDKIECVAGEQSELLSEKDSNIIGLACDAEGMNAPCSLPTFNRDDVGGIADFIAEHLGLQK